MNPLLLTDGYKTGHHQQYPQGTTLVYSNFTPRSNKYAPKGCNEVVVFGTQMTLKKIWDMFEYDFFRQPKNEVISEIKKELSLYLNCDYDTSHFEKLHDLGYLPLTIQALEEGSLCPMKVPVLTIYNTLPEFYWLPNFLETVLSNMLWKPMTSATIAYQYKKLLVDWCLKTDKDNLAFVDFQGHDFSMRGMDSIEATISSGLGHLTSFKGSDSLPTIYGARKYYNETGFVCASVPASEHSVMCSGGKEDEIETFKRLLNTYPTGILSVVSDTWDLWKVCTEYLPQLKEQIMSRDGKLVIRPDSGDPVDIICGRDIYSYDDERCYNNNGIIEQEGKHYTLKETLNNHPFPDLRTFDIDKEVPINEVKGVIELLWDVFGGIVNEQGYKVLDPHIGAIYGDSITLERAEQICQRLADKGFASTNIVLGIGSFTYQYNTRDTFGFAMKATYVERTKDNNNKSINVSEVNILDAPPESLVPTEGENGEILLKRQVNYKIEGVEIFKDPITDDGTKKSAKGLLAVFENENGELYLKDRCSWEQVQQNKLRTIFHNGSFYNKTSLSEIQEKLYQSIFKK